MDQTALNLLLIDDSADDASLLIRHLSRSGWQIASQRVETESEIRSALDTKNWDAFICDYNLPKLNTLQTIAYLRAQKPEVPCIVVSGSAGEEFAVETMRAGASDYIMKDNLVRLVPALTRELSEAITRRQKRVAEEALKVSEETYRQMQKFESIGQLAGGIAHDFNNILAVILVQTESLMETLKGNIQNPSMLEKGLNQIKQSSEKARNLTRQLLAYSRKQVIQPRVINLNALVNEIEQMLRRLIEENIELKFNLDAELQNINVDPSHIEQIILNLVVNARDALPKGGIIEVVTENSAIDELTARTCNVVAGPYVLMKVIDNGHGMTEEVKKKIFDPFFTTKPIGKGTGLGLSTVYGIVKQNKGLIFVESAVNKGTVFKVYFPITHAPVHMAKPHSVSIKTEVQDQTILFVEDEPELHALVSETLKATGFNIITAKNGVDALQKFNASKKPIHLLITDVVMPQMGGAELAQKVLAKNDKIKVLFTSGYAEISFRETTQTNQVYFIEKPYSLKEMLQKIKALLGERNGNE